MANDYINKIELDGTTYDLKIDAQDVPFNVAGDISATNVQSAIEELDTEKQGKLTAGANIAISSTNQISATDTTYTFAIDGSNDHQLNITPNSGSATTITLPDDSYTLAPASSNTLGGIKVGDNLSITNDGILSAVIEQSDWEQTNTSAKDYIKNKPEIYKETIQISSNDWQGPGSNYEYYVVKSMGTPALATNINQIRILDTYLITESNERIALPALSFASGGGLQSIANVSTVITKPNNNIKIEFTIGALGTSGGSPGSCEFEYWYTIEKPTN